MMIPIVYHIHLVIASVECNVNESPELQRSTALGIHSCKELTSASIMSFREIDPTARTTC